MQLQLSIIVCCYNSENLLKDTLTHLVKQVAKEDFKYEVVLVDNNSTDRTAQKAKDVWGESQTIVPLKIVKETQPGLSYARKKGVLACKGDIIVFCDDDNWLQENYLQIAFDFMIKNPEVGALGGQSEGVLEIDEPNWWQNQKANYAVGKQADNDGDLTRRGYLWGAGIVFRRRDLIDLYNSGFVSLLSGRKGKTLSSGDDSELCKWVMLMGYKLWYLEALKFKHYIPKKRLSGDYLRKLQKGHNQSQPILNLYNWFFYQGLYKKINEFTFQEKLYYFKKAIKKSIEKENDWRQVLQLGFGSSVKIQSDLYQIIKTYKRLDNRMGYE